jgi:hypothetical protein
MLADININDTFSSYEELLFLKETMKSIISFNYTQEHHKLWITSLREILPEKQR